MVIGVRNASRAFIKQRTGIEEYSYQVIKYLREELKNEKVFLYIRKNQKVEFALPENWETKAIKFPYLWTQAGLSLELFFHPTDVLFIPAHIIPIIHPKNTVVAIHGLEYEFCPKAYPFWERFYMRWSIKRSCKVAEKVIAVSENTKRDLMNLYKIPGEKIEVIYEGISENDKYQMSNVKSNPNDQTSKPYLLFIGRLEERKNICGVIKAFEILKEKYQISHDLILAGAPGYGYEIIKLKIKNLLKINNCKLKIIELGYVDEALKWQLMANADVFLFPTFYEGFGLPILEAQSVGVPIVASDNSSIQEILPKSDFGKSLVNPNNPSEIAEAAYKFISDKDMRGDIIKKGHENVKRFSWKKCSQEVAHLLINAK